MPANRKRTNTLKPDNLRTMDARSSYAQQSLQGANPLELIVALYDGAIRFLGRAAEAAAEDDVHGRRHAVKRVLDIIVYLQSRLRSDVGGRAAEALSEFYASMFTLTIEASRHSSQEQFVEVAASMRNVREAWRNIAQDPEALSALRKRASSMPAPATAAERHIEGDHGSLRWTA
jgi:flagellar protein FliS